MTLSADRFLVACGTRPLRRPDVPFDGSRIFDSDQLLWGGVDRVPRDLIVIGAGVIGMEYASMINVVPGTTVTVIDPREEVLGFADREVTQALCYSMRKNGARFLLGEKVRTCVRVRVVVRGCWRDCEFFCDGVVFRRVSSFILFSFYAVALPCWPRAAAAAAVAATSASDYQNRVERGAEEGRETLTPHCPALCTTR